MHFHRAHVHQNAAPLHQRNHAVHSFFKLRDGHCENGDVARRRLFEIAIRTLGLVGVPGQNAREPHVLFGLLTHEGAESTETYDSDGAEHARYMPRLAQGGDGTCHDYISFERFLYKLVKELERASTSFFKSLQLAAGLRSRIYFFIREAASRQHKKNAPSGGFCCENGCATNYPLGLR